MKNDILLESIEKSIIRITKDIGKKKGIVGSDKINSLSKLVNAYNRLKISTETKDKEKALCYHDMLERNYSGKFNSRN